MGVTDAQKATLDLRAWETAYNGAEPVRRETQDAFAAAFAQCGFHLERRAGVGPTAARAP